MSLYIGQHKAKAVHIGEDMIKRVYLGNAIVYQYDLDVSATLIGCSATLPSKVYYGEPLVAALVPDTGYQQLPWNTKVTMGGEDITSTAYDAVTNSINITEVTGDISIEAEAVEMSSDYEPLKYVEMLNNRRIPYLTNYNPTNHTQMEIVVTVPAINTRLLFGLNGYNVNTTPTTSTPAYWMWIRYTSGYIWMYNRTTRNDINKYFIKTGAKITVTVNEGVFTFPDGNGVTRTINNYVEDDFVTSQKMTLLGNGTSANGTYAGSGKIWRWKVSEQNVLLYDWVPCRRKSDMLVGLYDVHANAVLGIKDANCSIAPNVIPTRSLTNCAATLLSAATTGTATQAVIGSTWSIKIAPSSGYTFTGGTTPQVEIDGVDVTSQVVTDNGDGTYTVTIVDVPDKPISISAACVADPNAVQSNSLLTGTPTNTPDEPMGDNSDEEEM